MEGNFFQISSSSVSFLLASITTLIDNVLPIILPILGAILGIWILEALLNSTRHVINDSAWNYEEDPFLTEADKRYYRKTRPDSIYFKKREDEDEDEDEDL